MATSNVVKLGAAAVMAALLAGCGDQSGQDRSDKGRSPEEALKTESVAAAKKTPWPGEADGEVEIADDPTRDNYVVVMDMSGSMEFSECSGDFPTKAEAARNAVSSWMGSVPEDANLGLIVFQNGRNEVKVRLGVRNRENFRKAVRDTRADGGTPLTQGVRKAAKELTEQGRRQQGYGRYRMVLITDGEADDGGALDRAVERIVTRAGNPIEIFTLGFCIGESHTLNQPGRVVYKPASNPAELAEGLESVLAESQSFDPDEFRKLQEMTQGQSGGQ